MKRKLTLTIDDDVYDGIKELPRKVSISETVTWLLRAMTEDMKMGGITSDKFYHVMKNDERGREVLEYLVEKFGPVVSAVEEAKAKIKLEKKKK